MFFIRKDAVSKQAIKFLAPAIIMSGVVYLMNKIVMDASPNPLSGAFVYGLIMSFVVGVVTVINRKFFEEKRIEFSQAFHRGVFRGGLLLTMLIVIGVINKNIAMYYTPNPAYVGVISLAGPIWIAIYNKITGHRDKANIWAGFLFVFSAALLILLTR